MAQDPENLARVVLFDPIRQNLRTTRYALYELGFREIDTFSALGEVRERIEAADVDLLVMEPEDDPKVFNLVRDIRHSRIGRNPFSVIFLTCWTRDPQNIRQALESGADDLIARPFSTRFLDERVSAAIERRKRFVVTSDYIGPDRRSGPRAGAADPRYLSAPNTLKAAAKGDWEALEATYQHIKTVQEDVAKERVQRLSVRIAADLEISNPSSPSAEISVVKQARELERLAERVGPETASIAKALTKSLTDGEAGAPGKRWRVARELAHGVCVSSGHGDSSASEEIDRLVGKLREKQDSVAKDGGLEKQKGLHSAA